MPIRKQKPNTMANCLYCGKGFEYYLPPSSPPRKFCSLFCSNKARIKHRVGICPVCGKQFEIKIVGGRHWFKQTCSQSCGSKLSYIGKTKDEIRQRMHMAPFRKKTVWSDDKDNFLKMYYPNMGAVWCSKNLGISIDAIRGHANKLGLKLTSEATRRIVNNAARQYMTDHNPMKRPEVARKATDTQKANGSYEKTRHLLFMGKQLLMRNNPSKTQLKMKDMLDEIAQDYIHEFEVKDGFFVDFAIRPLMLIIQVDGCYWHGHKCRFNNLTDRQIAQKKRDAAQDKYLKTCGWKVIRIWECDINKRPKTILKRLSRLISSLTNRLARNATVRYTQIGLPSN